MGSSDHINAHDLENVISLDDLANYIKDNVIIPARAQNTSLDDFKSEIEKLKKYENLTKDSHISELFEAYKQIQATSMKLRQILSQFLAIEVYDSIDYAFYYNGKQYHTNKIDAAWLTKSKSTGELKLRLNAAAKDLGGDVGDIYKDRVNEIFNQHYAVYLAAIRGTYNGVIGRGGALNLGHIAEAYESHTAEHHPVEYRVMKNLESSTREMTIVDKAMVAYETETGAINYWANHEGIDAAWQHIRESLGTQRGTVAGDVGATQVKQGKTGAGRIRLARLSTLQEGVESYTLILDESVDPYVAALRIAKYISEPVRQVSATIIDGIKDKEIQQLFQDFNINAAKQIMVRL
jgi:hypothetical protein